MGRIDKDEVGYRQQIIMQCFWEAGGRTTVPDIDIRIEKKCGRKFSRSALNTMVQALIEKGLLAVDGKIHQSFIYKTCLTEKEFRLRELKRVRNLTFNGSTDILVQTLIESISDKEELDKVRQYLDRKEEGMEKEYQDIRNSRV